MAVSVSKPELVSELASRSSWEKRLASAWDEAGHKCA